MEWRMGNIMQAKKMWIAGEWCDSEDGATADVIDPSNGDVIATTPKATLGDVERCVQASKSAFNDSSWKKIDPAQEEESCKDCCSYIR